MDWMIFWTAAMAVVAVVSLIGGAFGWLRHMDWKNIEQVREDYNQKFASLQDGQSEIKGEVQLLRDDLKSKVERDEHNKDINLLRDDLKNYTNKLDTKLDKILDYIMNKPR